MKLAKKIKLWQIVLLCAVLLCVIIYFILPKALEVDTYKVSLGELKDIYKEEGIVSIGDDKHISSKVSADIVSVNVEENSRVKKGDILVTLDSSDLLSQKEILSANKSGLQAKKEESNIQRLMSVSPGEYLRNTQQGLKSAQTALDTAQSDMNSKQELFNIGAVSKVELDQAKTNLRIVRRKKV